MRAFQLILPLALVASPSLAQTQSPPPPEAIAVPPELTDPATADRVGDMMHALSKAFLNLRVGEIEAAAEGRPATRADAKRTIGDLGRKHNPDFDRNLDREIDASRSAVQASMKAFTAALPAVNRSIAEARRAIEHATANLPSPVYPRR
jgi:hypothetical protein